MPIPFACPYCAEETLVEDEFAGQSGPCVTCGKRITVPFVSDGQRFSAGETVTGIPHKGNPTARSILLIVVGAVLATVSMLSAVVLLLFPAVGAARSLAHRHGCDANLRRIGEALLSYEAEHGTLPPAYIPDETGAPMHSWRVLLLPHLGEHGLYNEYDFNQPWDSQHNQRFAKRMPEVFACPADPDAKGLGETNYMVIVGPRTLFPDGKAMSTADVGDELITTITVAEVPVFGVNWLEPKDLDVRKMQYVVNGGFGQEIGSYHDRGAHVLMADGSIRFIREELPSDYVQGMTTINGGEPIPWEMLGN